MKIDPYKHKEKYLNWKIRWGSSKRRFYKRFSIIYQQTNFFDIMREKVWDFILKQLIEEYGPEPDLKKYSILNSEFVYHRKPEKLPPSLIEQIEKETKERLTKLRLSHS